MQALPSGNGFTYRSLQPLRIIFRPFLIIAAVVQAAVALILSGLTLPIRLLFRSRDDDQDGMPESEPGIY